MDKPSGFRNVMFGSGGSSGLAYIGVIKAMAESGRFHSVENWVGVSAGAFAALVCSVMFPEMGEKADEEKGGGEQTVEEQINEQSREQTVEEQINEQTAEGKKMDAEALSVKIKEALDQVTSNLSRILPSRIGLAVIPRLLSTYGAVKNSDCYDAIHKTVRALGLDSATITLKGLWERTGNTLVCVATELGKGKMARRILLSWKTFPNMLLVDALRMSISVPFLFPPLISGKNIYVDGGILGGCPLNIFDVYGKCGRGGHTPDANSPEFEAGSWRFGKVVGTNAETVGVAIRGGVNKIDSEGGFLRHYSASVFHCMYQAMDNLCEDSSRSIIVPGLPNSLSMPPRKQVDDLIQDGYNIAKDFLESVSDPESKFRESIPDELIRHAEAFSACHNL